MAAVLAYNEEKRWSKTPEKFGTGHDQGVAAPEASNNAVVAGALIFVAGFLAKALGFCGGLGWGEVWSFANREHFFAGSALVGLSSLAGALIEFCSTFYRIGRIGGIYSPFPDLGGRGGGGGGGGDAQKIILVIVVVIGLLVALHWIYKHLQILAEAAARRTQDIVLDYDHHRPREEEQQGEVVADMEAAEYGTPARVR